MNPSLPDQSNAREKGSKHDDACLRRREMPGMQWVCTCDMTDQQVARTRPLRGQAPILDQGEIDRVVAAYKPAFQRRMDDERDMLARVADRYFDDLILRAYTEGLRQGFTQGWSQGFTQGMEADRDAF